MLSSVIHSCYHQLNSTQLNSSLFKSCSRKAKNIQCSATDNQF